MTVRRPVEFLPRPYEPPITPSACTSAPLPWRILPCPGISHSMLTRRQTCHILGIVVGDDSPPPVPLSCTTYGGAQSGPGGRPELCLFPVNPSPGKPCHLPPKGKKSCTSGVPPGGGGSFSGIPLPPYVETDDGLPVTLAISQHCIQGGRLYPLS